MGLVEVRRADGLYVPPQNFFYLIPFAPIGQVYACSVVATLMKRASFAKELAQQHAHGAEDRNIDTFADAAPLSIAKPVLRRIMKREEAKKPLQVQMTTVVHQVADEEENYGYDNVSTSQMNLLDNVVLLVTDSHVNLTVFAAKSEGEERAE